MMNKYFKRWDTLSEMLYPSEFLILQALCKHAYRSGISVAQPTL